MYKSFLTFVFLLAAGAMMAQGAFRYQGVARNNMNQVLQNQDISLRLSILQENNVPAYTETHQTTTSELGLFSVSLCDGTPVFGSCDDVIWGSQDYRLRG